MRPRSRCMMIGMPIMKPRARIARVRMQCIMIMGVVEVDMGEVHGRDF